MKNYFAYGSNLMLGQMKERCPEHVLIGIGKLSGYRWIITTRCYANIVKSEGDYVLGMIYEISSNDEISLDLKEGVKKGFYQKVFLDVMINDKAIICLIYIDPTEQEGKPKDEYITRINQGLKDSNLSIEYIDQYIRKFVPRNEVSQ